LLALADGDKLRSAMGYEQDYIKRLMQKIGEVLARALGVGKGGNYDESLQVLEQGVGSELGMPFAMLLRLEPKAVVSLLGPAKASAFAEALRTRAALFGLAHRDADAKLSAGLAETIESLLER
jgi:hypothetical protein